MNLRKELELRIVKALQTAGAPEGSPALVALAGKPQFGDYQANGCMAAAKKMKTNPRQFAEKVLENLDLSDLTSKVELAGPGFINIFLDDKFLADQTAKIASDEKLGLAGPNEPQTVVVDYSGPNLAKEMHVGHLRSTIIGDALARVLSFQGHNVIRQNHVGDWGTQFGMLLEHLYDQGLTHGEGQLSSFTTGWGLGDLEGFYRAAKTKYDEDPALSDFAKRARERVVLLQGGDEKTKDALVWFIDESLDHCKEVYEKLGVLLTAADVRGESFYNEDLSVVIDDLKKAEMLEESDGAMGVFLDEFRNMKDERAFIIVRKSDGGYLYATTDLAALRYRSGELAADRIIYVTDSRQAQHFAQVFLIARKAEFVPDTVSLEHVPFGMMLGTDGLPFKTRTGGTVKLMDLLEEAEDAAGNAMNLRPDVYPEARLSSTYRAIGIGALKYADLSQNRTSDYVFSWDKMLSLEGNTAPYMQYAYARIRSIFRKQESTDSADFINKTDVEIQVTETAERSLAVKLLQFSETVDSVAENCLPNVLCAYLFDLAGAFMSFYENCPVLKSEGDTRSSRLALCDLTARVIKQGLDLLGIETIEQM